MHDKALAITDPYLDVYQGMDSDSEVVGRLYKNTEVDVLQISEGWTKISSGNCEGYTKTAALLFGQEAEAITASISEDQRSQFSGVSDGAGSPSAKFQSRINSGLRSQACMDAAVEALSGHNNIGGYTSFRMISAANISSMSSYVIIGNHVFH